MRIPGRQFGPLPRRLFMGLLGGTLAVGSTATVASALGEKAPDLASGGSMAGAAAPLAEGPAAATAATAAAAAPLAEGPVAAVDLGDGTYTAPYEVVQGVKVFRLRMAPVRWEVSPGVVKEAWAFNGTVPGPTLRFNEGDRVRFIVQNGLSEMTGVHWHGMDLPNDQDGVPHITQHPIMPGETFTYEWTAVSTGTHWYHAHMGGNQVGKGLYGALEIVPKLGEIRSDRDYRVIINDGFLGFVLNGKSFPATRPLKAEVGERVRLRLIGSGPEMIHPVHLHGGFFELLAQDGHMLPFPVKMDTLNTGVGQTYDILFIPTRPGKWLLHCHIFSHSEAAHGMQGMVTYLDVAPGVAVPGEAELPEPPALPELPVQPPELPVQPVQPAQPVPSLSPQLSSTSTPPLPHGPSSPHLSALPEVPLLP